MQQAIPYKSWPPLHTKTLQSFSLKVDDNPLVSPPKVVLREGEDMLNMVSENAVIVFARRGCCMSHVVKRLLLGLGVNPAIYEVDEKDEIGIVKELETLSNTGKDDGKVLQFPAVFIGGSLFGGLDRVMATHISGELIPILKDAGALWL